MKNALIILTLSFTLASCGTSNDFSPLDNFNIQEGRFEDSTPVQVLFCNYGPIGNIKTENQDGSIRLTSDYFAHIVANNGNGDTFNILSRVVPSEIPNAQGEAYYFINNSAEFQSQYDMMTMPLTQSTDKTYLKYDQIKKVVFMPELDKLVKNSYPSYFGRIRAINN